MMPLLDDRATVDDDVGHIGGARGEDDCGHRIRLHRAGETDRARVECDEVAASANSDLANFGPAEGPCAVRGRRREQQLRSGDGASAANKALTEFDRPRLEERIDLRVGVRADTERTSRPAQRVRGSDPVTELLLGRRAQAD